MSSHVIPIRRCGWSLRVWGIISPEQRWPRDEPVDCDRGGERAISTLFQTFNVIDNGTATPLGAQYVQWVK